MQAKIKINLSAFYIAFILLPYLKPYNVTLFPEIDNVFKIWKVLVTIIIIATFVIKKAKISVGVLFLWLFSMSWFVSLILNGDNYVIVEFGNNILSIIGISMFFENSKNENRKKEQIVSSLYTISCIYLFLNMITAILGYPFGAEGMNLGDNANFLGGDNYSAFILIVLCGIILYYDLAYKKAIRLKTWLFAICGLVSLIIPFALTGIISYVFLLFAFILRKSKFFITLFKRRNILLLAVILTLSIGFLDLSVLFEEWLFVLEKTGFNGRNYIWPYAVNAILKKPLLGYGGVGVELASDWLLAGANHTHNIILEFPFSVGLVGTIFFIAYIVQVFKGIKLVKNVAVQPLLLTLSAFLLCSIFDFYIGLIYFYLLLELIRLNKDDVVLDNSKVLKREE